MNHGNPFLGPVPCQAETVLLTNPATGQQALAFTLRHAAGETTVFLSREQAESWRGMHDAKIAKMTTLITTAQPEPGPLPFRPFPSGNDHQPPGFRDGRRP